MDGSDGGAGGCTGTDDANIALVDRHLGHQPHAGRHHVRHGTDTVAAGLQDCVEQTQGHPHRLPHAVHRDALAGLSTDVGLRPARGTGHRRDTRGLLSWWHGIKRHHLSGQGRPGPVSWYDGRLHPTGPTAHTLAGMGTGWHHGRCGCTGHADEHRLCGHRAHRLRTALPAFYPQGDQTRDALSACLLVSGDSTGGGHHRGT